MIGHELLNAHMERAQFEFLDALKNTTIHPAKLWWKKCTDVLPVMTGPSRTFPYTPPVPNFREFVGGRVKNQMAYYEWTLDNVQYELSFILNKQEWLRWDGYGVIDRNIKAIAEKALDHPRQLIKTLIDGAGTLTCYDGLPFFSASHTNPDATTWSNMDNAGGYANPWFIADCSNPNFMPFIFGEEQQVSFYNLNGPTSQRQYDDGSLEWGAEKWCAASYGMPHCVYASDQTPNEANVCAAIEALLNRVDQNGDPYGFVPTHIFFNPSAGIDVMKAIRPVSISGTETVTQYLANLEPVMIPGMAFSI
jgi:phage major head subunit gpT-like protein